MFIHRVYGTNAHQPPNLSSEYKKKCFLECACIWNAQYGTYEHNRRTRAERENEANRNEEYVLFCPLKWMKLYRQRERKIISSGGVEWDEEINKKEY